MARARDFPENGELVVCTVTRVKNFGAFVTLDEYDQKEGFIHVRDVTTGWVKYIRDYVREGQKVVCKVLGVDSQKGHIDLSLKSVNDHQKRERIQQWKNEKKADKLLEIVAERMGIAPDAAFDMFGRRLLEDYGTLYEAFEAVVSVPEEFADYYRGGEWVGDFIEVAGENIAPPAVQIDGVLEMASSAPDGVVLIREALEAGIAAGGDADVSITSIGSPRYRVVVRAGEYKEAEEVMKTVADTAIRSLLSGGGTAVLKRESRCHARENPPLHGVREVHPPRVRPGLRRAHRAPGAGQVLARGQVREVQAHGGEGGSGRAASLGTTGSRC